MMRQSSNLNVKGGPARAARGIAARMRGRGRCASYKEAIRVPLVVRGPGVPAGLRVERMVVNNDLAPTLAAIAGIEPPSYVNGRSRWPDGREPLGWCLATTCRLVSQAPAQL